MIKIVKGEGELSEDRLNQLEAQGLTLISVNYVKDHKYVEGLGRFTKTEITEWTYHFRSAAEKMHGDRGRNGIHA